MYFLITKNDNKTERDILWGEEVTNEELNSNYYFTIYDSPEKAVYLYPFYEETAFDKILWSVETLSDVLDGGLRSKCSKVKTIKKHDINFPVPEKRITLAILCAYSLVKNEEFKNWALSYLSGKDTSKESAYNLHTKLQTADEEEEGLDCAFPALSSVVLNSPEQFSANAIHRAYCDSIDLKTDLNLDQLIKIVNVLTNKEISDMLI
jgi:hypothetical protein